MHSITGTHQCGRLGDMVKIDKGVVVCGEVDRGIDGRSVKISLPRTEYLTLCEVEVIGIPQTQSKIIY